MYLNRSGNKDRRDVVNRKHGDVEMLIVETILSDIADAEVDADESTKSADVRGRGLVGDLPEEQGQ